MNEVNPGTGQSGLLVRPVNAFGDAKVAFDGQAGNTATVDLTLTTVGKWLVKADAYQIDNGSGTVDGQGGTASALFLDDALSSNHSIVRPSNWTMTITRPSAGVVRGTFGPDVGPIADTIFRIIISAIRYE